MEGSAEDGMKGVEVLRSRGLPSKVLDQVGVSCLAANNVNTEQTTTRSVYRVNFLSLSGPCQVEDWVWAVWDNSEPDREDFSAAEVFLFS